MFKKWTVDDWMNHILLAGTLLGLAYIWFGH
jgi:hypothetical protein